MKGQGLPISFVVLAAIAILILVLAVAFIIGIRGSATTVLTQSQAQTKCQEACNTLKTWAQNQDLYLNPNSWPSDRRHPFCNNYTVKGLGTVDCTSIIACTVEDVNGLTYTVSCSNGVPQFS